MWKTRFMKLTLMLAPFAAAGCWPWHADSNLLDGKIYAVEMVEDGKSSGQDRLVFKSQTCDSTLRRQLGFSKTRYTTLRLFGTSMWKATATSPTEGKTYWNGKVKGDQIRGRMVWEKDGKKRKYTFSGTILPPLYERLGEENAIKAVVDEFLNVLVKDSLLNANPKIDAARKKVNLDELKAKLTALLCEVTGGPQKYTGRTMKESHAHLDISGKEWDRMAEIFVTVLDTFKVPKPEQEELLEIVGTTKADIVMRPDE